LAFTVDASILGGLQMYTESKFMDMSLASRMDKIRNDISKMVS
jgi:F0F1-type ATP synthase delta subunit